VVDYWHLGENDPGAVAGAAMTNSVDIAGSATLTNSELVTYSSNVSTYANAKTGSYLALQFTNTAYATSQVISNFTDNFGVEAWVNPASTSGFQSIFYNGNTGGSGWGLYVADNQFAGLFGGVSFIFGSVTFTPGTWNHVALVESGGTATLYVNGAVSGTIANSPRSPAGRLTVGANQDGTENFPGLIDEVRVFTFAAGQFSTNDLLLAQNSSFNLAITNIQVSASAGSSNVAMTVSPPTVLWTFLTTNAWLHPASTAGMGSTNLTFAFDANLSPNAGPRSGTLTVAGRTVTVNQAAATYVLATNLFTLPLSAGSNEVILTVSPGVATWTASTTVPWIHLAVTNGTGSAAIPFTFDPDIGFPPRSGAITAGGRQVTVLQGPQVVVTNLLEGSGAGVETVPVFFLDYLPGALSAVANDSWLHISPNGASATAGNANVAFTLDANPNAAPRTGTLTIQGTTVTVTQAGSNYQAAQRVQYLDLSPYLSTNEFADYGPLPFGVAVDNNGNLYVAMNSRMFGTSDFGSLFWGPGFGDNPTGFILKCPTNGPPFVLTANPGEPNLFPRQIGLDANGNVYFNDGGTYAAIFEWQAATSNVTQKVTFNGNLHVGCFAVDSGGNLTFAADFDPAHPFYCHLYELSALGGPLVDRGMPPLGTTPPTPELDVLAMDFFGRHYFSCFGLADFTLTDFEPQVATDKIARFMVFDDSMNMYFSCPNGIFKLSEADFGIRLVSDMQASGVAVDHARNVYAADDLGTMVWVIPHAFLNPAPKWENGYAGSDALPAVFPANTRLDAQFAPASDQPWLTITGVTNGVVSYSFTANLGTSNRVAHINVLGVPVTITQSVVVTPPALAVAYAGPGGGGDIQISFTNNPDATFTVLTSPNVAAPLATWTVLGAITNLGGGLFQFVTPGTNAQQFYRVRSP